LTIVFAARVRLPTNKTKQKTCEAYSNTLSTLLSSEPLAVAGDPRRASQISLHWATLLIVTHFLDRLAVLGEN